MDRFDPFVKYADVYGDIINWEKDPMNKPQNQNKYFFSDGKTYYEQICKMLRLMSVFKEAFNQIYSNEDEISEAWENFVNNLSASVVEGSEPDVTLTWTDDSVNFEFTMVPGVPGEQGVGITSISFNSDYTMTITLSDGNTYTSMSLKGETGPQGPQGETGSGLQILDVYATLADLQSAHPTGQPGDAYQVGSAGNYTLYIWSSSQSSWVPAGSLDTVSPSVSNPLMDGTASAGSSNLYSRGDHVHPSDTSRASKEELDALIKISQSLIDQSFTYRKSPAIQDGLARMDKIKGNTLNWNQLVQNGNFADTSSWSINVGTTTFTVSSNEATITAQATNGGLYSSPINIAQGHKYLVSFETKNTNPARVGITQVGGRQEIPASANYAKTSFVATADSSGSYPFVIYNRDAVSNTINVKNVMLFDLTQIGLDISSPSEFTSLFSLPFYDYNQGTLLSFNGNGIKTVGKNLWDNSQLIRGIYTDADFSYSPQNVQTSIKWYGFAGTTYTVSWGIPVNLTRRIIEGVLTTIAINNVQTFTLTPSKDGYIGLTFRDSTSVSTQWNPNTTIQIEEGSFATSYEHYKESILSLPISMHFPTGMKSAGNAYDELTENKAITRIGAVDLGTLTWERTTTQGSDYRFFSSGISSVIKKPNTLNDVANIICSKYQAERGNGPNAQEVGIGIHTNGNVLIYDTVYASATAEEFKSAMSGVYLYYELATSVETAVDLDMSFISYLDGTEQLLPVNGSVPSTSPIIADMAYLSIDDAMTSILDKLANVPQNTQQILESLEDDVADLQTDTGNLQTAVSGLQTSVGNINTNIGQLSSTVAGNTSSISDIQSDISDLNTGLSDLNTGLNDLEDTVTNNTSRIGTLETGLTNTDSQVDAIDARVLNLETDLLIVVKKEYDYDSVAGNTNFGVQTGLSQEPGYKIIGIVGSEVQQGEYTSAEPWIIVTQAHVHYTSTGGVVLSMMARNVSEYTKTNVRVYLYLLCIKDTQSQ